jgi:pyruvate dehydrogenase E2 component (dihydrolipoamide acetyltransferase)
MEINVVMPQMGEAVLEGTVTKWLKKIGDSVSRDESLFEVSTDKVDTEIPAPENGVLREVLVKEGDTVKVGTVVAVLEAAKESESKPPAGTDAAVEPSPVAPPEAALPGAGSGLETAPAAPGPAPADAAPPATEESPAFVRTSPLVRRIAREHGIDLSRVRGTGLSGRLRKEDLQAYMEPEARAEEPVGAVPQMQPPARAAEPGVAPGPEPPSRKPSQEALQTQPAAPAEVRPAADLRAAAPIATPPRMPEDYEIVAMSPMRKAIAEHMVLSRRTSAHVQTVFEVDMTPIVHLREKHSDEFEARTGISLTYTPFFAKALVETIARFPILNSSVSDDRIVYKNSVNLGIAVALESGLIVPVVMGAHAKSFSGLALAIHDLAKRARTKKLKPEEVQNGTVTLTNPGIFGSLMGTPIINQPQVAILCAGTLEKRPVIINDAIAVRTMVYLVLSFDHRIIDGAIADQAMAALKSKLQSWNTWRE